MNNPIIYSLKLLGSPLLFREFQPGEKSGTIARGVQEAPWEESLIENLPKYSIIHSIFLYSFPSKPQRPLIIWEIRRALYQDSELGRRPIHPRLIFEAVLGAHGFWSFCRNKRAYIRRTICPFNRHFKFPEALAS